VNGQLVGHGQAGQGPICLLANLRLGEDCGPLTNRSNGPTSCERFAGAMDDVLIAGRALEPSEIGQLYREGAEAALQ
jgi:hypothetical protein